MLIILEQYFLELVEIDNVHPNEKEVLEYVKSKLKAFGVPFKQDEFGNIVAKLESEKSNSRLIGLSGHVDIAAPLKGRKITKTDDKIKTDGTSILGGDDKTAVAAMLKLAEDWAFSKKGFNKSSELIFTCGEESGLQGAKNLDYSLVTAEDILVFDWYGPVSNVVTRSPAYVKIDIEFIGKNAHPAEWQKGKNAGQCLMKAAGSLKQGEFEPGVTFNIGKVQIGEARNQVPGTALLLAEVRSFDFDKAKLAAQNICEHFRKSAKSNRLKIEIDIDSEASNFSLQKDSKLCRQVIKAIEGTGLKPSYEETYGCFDGNVFASHGKNVVVLGAAFYNPHGPEEYINRKEFAEMYGFMYRLFTG